MATFTAELDDLRLEVRKSVATTLSFWPKVSGSGNVYVSATPTFTVYDPDGASVQASSNASLTQINTNEYTRIDCAVPAIGTLGEDYRIDILWVDDATSTARRDQVYFDCVLYPYGPPSVSLNDLLEERPDAAEILARHGALLGFSASTAQAQMASIYAVRARVELDALIRDQVRQDSQSESYTSTGISADHYTRPNLILNRERLNRVERKLAMRQLFAADMSSPEGEDESAALFRFYADESDKAWRGIGPLKYDSSEDLVPDETVTDLGRVRALRRVQA